MLTHQVEAISREVGHAIPYAVFRRNLVLESSLEALEFQHCYRLGSALLEITGPCPPCARMKEKLGEVGFRAMRGRGGYTARVIAEGSIYLGDVLTPTDLGPIR